MLNTVEKFLLSVENMSQISVLVNTFCWVPVSVSFRELEIPVRFCCEIS